MPFTNLIRCYAPGPGSGWLRLRLRLRTLGLGKYVVYFNVSHAQYAGGCLPPPQSFFFSGAKMTKARKLKICVAEITSYAHILAPKLFSGQVSSLTYDVTLKGLHMPIWADLNEISLGHLYSTVLAKKWIGGRVT